MSTERDDDLRDLYLEASAQDPRRPAAQVRDAVRAHARMLVHAQTPHAATAPVSRARVSNQARWNMRAMASVAVLGLAGLLVLQFDRGTPQEKELVAGLPQVSATAPPNPLPPVVVPAQAPVVTATTAAITTTTPAAVAATATGAGAANDAGIAAAPGNGEVTRTETAKTAADVPTVAAAPAQARTAQSPVASVAPPPANPAATAALGPVAPKAAMRSRLAAADSVNAAQALLDAARLGQLETMNRLLVPGALVDAPDANGQTPLMLAAINGHIEVVRRLLAAGARRDLRDRSGQTAADHARGLGQGDILRLLEAGS